MFLDNDEQIAFAIENMPNEDVWSIGRKNAVKLVKIGINAARDFAAINNYERIHKRFTITRLHTGYELNGKSVLGMEYLPPDKKGLCTARSFEQKTDYYKVIEDALCAFVQNSAPKLRKQGSYVANCKYSFRTANLK